jgi:transcription elongation factor GreB
MSKAFVKEEGAEEEEGGDEPSATRGSPYITRAGFVKLQQELKHLWRVERPKVTNEVAVAAAQGDRSENAEYIYGKKKLREIDRRIRFLTKRIDALTIVMPAKEQEGRVFFGAWVEVEDEDGKKSRYRIVGSDEFDTKLGWISVESPIARALIGKRVGDVVTVRRPMGEVELTIVAIRYHE